MKPICNLKKMTIFVSILLLGVSFTFAEKTKQSTPVKQVPGKRAAQCYSILESAKKEAVGSFAASAIWAEAYARAEQLESFEKEMPKSDMLPYFEKACALYAELIKLHAANDRLCKITNENQNKRAQTMREIEKVQQEIGQVRSGKVSSLEADLAAAQDAVEETSEEAKKREAELQNQALAREDSLRKASEWREAELQRALQEERAKAEARQNEAKHKLNELQSKLIQVTEDARGIILSMSDILFDVDKATLKPDLKNSLAKIAGILSVYQELNVSVEGHTDNTGSEAHNLKLSKQRAENVLKFLVSQGIAKERLTATGFGMSQPVGDNSTKEGRQKNRRVDLVIRDKVLQKE